MKKAIQILKATALTVFILLNLGACGGALSGNNPQWMLYFLGIEFIAFIFLFAWIAVSDKTKTT